MKVKSENEVAQSCPTLSDPMDCSLTLSDPMDSSLPGSSVHGIFQARVLEWGATAFSTPPFLGWLYSDKHMQVEHLIFLRLLGGDLQLPVD